MFTNARRRYLRFDLKDSLVCWIMDADMKKEISNKVNLVSRNISLSGMMFLWPRSWDCSKCIKCLGWVYNVGCHLKKNNLKDTNMLLEPGLIIKIKPNLDRKENYSFLSRDLIFVKVVWSNNRSICSTEFYPVGVSFIHETKKLFYQNFNKKFQ